MMMMMMNQSHSHVSIVHTNPSHVHFDTIDTTASPDDVASHTQYLSRSSRAPRFPSLAGEVDNLQGAACLLHFLGHRELRVAGAAKETKRGPTESNGP